MNRSARRRSRTGHARERALRTALDVADRLMQPGAYSEDLASAPVAPGRGRWATIPLDAQNDTARLIRATRPLSRELARTHPVAVGALGTYLDRVIGTGLALVAEPDRQVLGWSEDQAAAWKAGVQREFSLWSDSAECDIRGELNFYEKQRLVAQSRAESGDVFTVLPDTQATAAMPYALRLQTLEADRIANPGLKPDDDHVAGGVRRDPAGRPVAYHVLRHHPGSLTTGLAGARGAGDWIEAVGPSGRRRILHHWQPTRPEQGRGVPWFAPVVALLRDLDRYTEAEIKAAVVSALFTVFVKMDEPPAPSKVFGSQSPGQSQLDVGELELGFGAILGLRPGQSIVSADAKRPNVAFEPFFSAISIQIGMALSLPADLLLKRFNASYSASRAALLDAWMFLRTQRTWLARSFCQPVYETWLTEAVIRRRVAAPGYFGDPLLRWAYTRAAWHGDSQGSINPKDEVEAYANAIDGGLMSHERAEWELFGTDWNATLPQKVRERQLMKAGDLLPQPKPGAPAPAKSDNTPPAKETEKRPDALAAIAGALGVLAAREPAVPTVHVAPPAVTVHAGDAHITAPPVSVSIGDTHTSVALPDGLLQLEATVVPPPVHVEVAPAPVVIAAAPPQATRQLVERDAAGEIVAVTTLPLDPAGG